LGGNSRTTLIINCSPSSYNEAETISTLRFGARAKTIKNKAKVNADLSPAELKALLRRVKGDAVTFRQYISALESEINMWRTGKRVAESDWASMDKPGAKPAAAAAPASPAPAFKSPEEDSRPSTPAMTLGKDEKEEFLKREQELLEQITEKAAELSNREKQAQEIQEMLEELKDNEKQFTHQNKQMSTELNEAKLQLEKQSYEKKEAEINVDSLRELNLEYMAEREELKATLDKLLEEQQKIKENMEATQSIVEDAKEKEKEIELNLAQDNSPETIHKLKQELSEAKAAIEQHKVTITNLEQENHAIQTKRDDLETRFNNLEVDYEELLDKTIAMEEQQYASQDPDIIATMSDLKSKLESQYAKKREIQQKEIEILRADIESKSTEETRLEAKMAELQQIHDKLKRASIPVLSKDALEQKERDLERMRKSMAQELADFDTMKKVLMRDLQARCEKVVELEITLDETRAQQNNLLKATSNKAQQKKMALLERNLDQLTNVQKQVSIVSLFVNRPMLTCFH
jgi:kinesin family protein 5